jgi:hypothetical protein
MVVNQLFSEKPSLDLINRYIKTFGLNNIDDTTEFTILDMMQHNTLIQIQMLHNELADIYLPCKKQYINNLDNKTAITVLRQLLKIYDHDLLSREKFIKATKYLVYKIVSKQEKIFYKKPNKNIKKKDIVIVFD